MAFKWTLIIGINPYSYLFKISKLKVLVDEVNTCPAFLIDTIYCINFIKKCLQHFLTFTPTNWLLFVRYLSYNLLYLSNMIVVPLIKTIFRSNTWKNDGLQKQMFLTLIAFSHVFHLFLAIYFSRSSQSSSCYQQRQQLLQWPLQRHVECAQLFQNYRISNLL